jgi:hypothetical protein
VSHARESANAGLDPRWRRTRLWPGAQLSLASGLGPGRYGSGPPACRALSKTCDVEVQMSVREQTQVGVKPSHSRTDCVPPTTPARVTEVRLVLPSASGRGRSPAQALVAAEGVAGCRGPRGTAPQNLQSPLQVPRSARQAAARLISKAQPTKAFRDSIAGRWRHDPPHIERTSTSERRLTDWSALSYS